MKTKTQTINDMDTTSILLHLVYRHRVVLLITALLCSNIAWLVTQFNQTIF